MQNFESLTFFKLEKLAKNWPRAKKPPLPLDNSKKPAWNRVKNIVDKYTRGNHPIKSTDIRYHQSINDN